MSIRLQPKDVAAIEAAGGQFEGQARNPEARLEVDKLALRILGLLAEASSNDVRRRALERARRILSTR